MGALTPIDKVWYPDKTDLDQPDVFMATHSQSIEEGIGARLRQQEVAVGLKANVPAASFSMTSVAKTVPYVVSSDFGSFKQGMSIDAGVVTIETRGMYLCTMSLGIGASAGQRAIKIELFKGTTKIAMNEAPNTSAFWATAQATCVVSCVPGDTIYVKATVVNEPTNAGMLNSNEGAYHFLSVAMVQAVPTP